jgi:hypothetical protein
LLLHLDGFLLYHHYWEKFVTCDSHDITTQKNAAAFATAPTYRAYGPVNANNVSLIQSRCKDNDCIQPKKAVYLSMN